MKTAIHLVPLAGQAAAFRERRAKIRAALEDRLNNGVPIPPAGPQHMDLHDILINRLLELQVLADQFEARAKFLEGIPGCYRVASRDAMEVRGLYAAVAQALLALDASREYLRARGLALGEAEQVSGRSSYAGEPGVSD